MKRLIALVSLFFTFSVFAQTGKLAEPSWKTSLRAFVSSIAGEEWGARLVGLPPVPEVAVAEVSLPEIPIQVKSSTDVSTYSKKTKELTAFDRLPTERKRQFDYNFIQELFKVTRKSQAKDEDVANWINTLDQGGSREGIYQALVLDEVYAAMENMEERPSPKLTEFYVKSSHKFLNQALKEESLAKLNLYSLKRIFVEKGLDLIEYYETKNLDDLYRWYANFSADLAKDHPDLLPSEVRKETTAAFHYQWAKDMPLQHLKSEFIIKVHTVMNGLQLVQ